MGYHGSLMLQISRVIRYLDIDSLNNRVANFIAGIVYNVRPVLNLEISKDSQ